MGKTRIYIMVYAPASLFSTFRGKIVSHEPRSLWLTPQICEKYECELFGGMLKSHAILSWLLFFGRRNVIFF